jgi:hypothetical protein
MTDVTPSGLPALGICVEEYQDPYRVQFLSFSNLSATPQDGVHGRRSQS